MRMIVFPGANGIISSAGQILGQALPEGAALVEVASTDLPPNSAARVKPDGSVEIVANWTGSGPWFDPNATTANRETAIHITELGVDPEAEGWAMTPRPETPAERAAREAAEAATASAAEAARIAALVVDDIQFSLACVQAGIVTAAEAEAWAGAVLPASLAAAIELLPEGQRAEARIRAAGMKEFRRSASFVVALGAAMGKTPAEIDALFLLAATL